MILKRHIWLQRNRVLLRLINIDWRMQTVTSWPLWPALSPGSFNSSLRPPETLFKVIFWLGYFNSCLNPIIYPCYSREFKQVRRRRSSAPPPQGSSSPLCLPPAGLHPDPALPLEEQTSGLAGVLQLPLPAGLQRLVLPERQPADALLRRPQPPLRLRQAPPPSVALLRQPPAPRFGGSAGSGPSVSAHQGRRETLWEETGSDVTNTHTMTCWPMRRSASTTYL